MIDTGYLRMLAKIRGDRFRPALQHREALEKAANEIDQLREDLRVAKDTLKSEALRQFSAGRAVDGVRLLRAEGFGLREAREWLEAKYKETIANE